MRVIFIHITCWTWLLSAGCMFQYSPQVLPAVFPDGERLYLSDKVLLEKSLDQYYQVRDLSSEDGKIDYLLGRIQASDYIFVRNGVEYSGRFSSEFLSWKLGRVREQKISQVETADVFIEKVASKSKMSNKPYLIKIASQYYYCSELLKNELFYLNDYLKNKEETVSSAVAGVAQSVENQETAPRQENQIPG